MTFKGGTSLSKGWKLIDRFSEDIDVVIDRAFLGYPGEDFNSKKIKKLRDNCSAQIQKEVLPALENKIRHAMHENLIWKLALASKTEDPDQQTLLFEYPSIFPDASAYVRRVVKIELGARSDTDPSESPSIQPLLYEAFPDQLGIGSFSLCTVAPRRTFWEKAMLLHEVMLRPKEKALKPRLARHYYDLHCLIKKGIGAEALADSDLFDRVLEHRQIFFNQKWVDYKNLKKGFLKVVPEKDELSDWQKDYDAMRGEMFSTIPPTFDDILTTVGAFQHEFNRT